MTAVPFSLEVGKEDRNIRGEVFTGKPSASTPVLVICHGFKGFKDWGFFPYAAEELATRGFTVITFNFSMNGVGEVPDQFTELDKFARNTYSREQEDLTLLFAALRTGRLPLPDDADIQRIGLIGHSRGGANSLLFALDHPAEVQAVALWNSIANVDLFSPQMKQEMKEQGKTVIVNARTQQEMPILAEVLEDIESHREQFDILGRLSQLHQPLLILQGDEDLAVPVHTAVDIDKRAPQSQLHILLGANHTFGAVHPFQGTTPHLSEALDKTASFFHYHLG
jgi:uncharacterized protein